MHLPSFGKCADQAVEEVLEGLLHLKMFSSPRKKWFVRKNKKQCPVQQPRSARRPGAKRRTRWTAQLLQQHRQKLLSELDVNAVLPYLVYDKVFSLREYKEILGQESNKMRAEIFLDCLSSKEPADFCSFCSVLEEVCPHLLTCLLLDGDDGAPGGEEKAGVPMLPNSSGGEPMCPPPVYPDPRIHPSPTAGSVTAASSASTVQGKPSLRRIKGRIHRSKSLDSIDLMDSNDINKTLFL